MRAIRGERVAAKDVDEGHWERYEERHGMERYPRFREVKNEEKTRVLHVLDD